MAENQRKLDELRREQSELGSHLVDELLAGRLDRREFVRRGTVVGISAASIGGILAACGSANSSDSGSSGAAPSSSAAVETGVVSQQSSSSAATTAATGKKGGTIRVGVVVPAGAIEPWLNAEQGSIVITSLVGEYLARAQTDLSLRPELAQKWTPSADVKTWTFELTKGATFSDGRPVTAADVASSFDRMTDPKGGSAALSAFAGVLSKGQTEAQGESTVVFHLDAANASFPYLVCSQIYNTVILPKDYKLGDWEKTWLGTGPFKLVKYTPKQGATFVRNPNYWDKSHQPLLDGVNFTFFEGEQPQILALQGGQVDIVNQISFQGGRSLFTSPNAQIFAVRSATHREIAMRVDKDPFKNKLVRQAIALSLDRKALIQQLFSGKGEVGNDSPFWAGYPSTNTSVPQRVQDVAKAKQLLEQAGMKSFDATLTTERIFEIPDLAVQLQQAVKAIGGNLKLNIITATQYFAGGPKETPWLNAAMNITDYGHRPTPNVFLGAPLQTGGIWNAAHFSNPAYDALVKQYTAEVDVQKAQAIAGKIQALLLDETPIIIPYFYNYLAAGSKKVQGYVADPQSLMDLRSTSLA